jgi:hypothetical protein
VLLNECAEIKTYSVCLFQPILIEVNINHRSKNGTANRTKHPQTDCFPWNKSGTASDIDENVRKKQYDIRT